MSNDMLAERKKPHFISTEFKAQRVIAEQHLHDVNLKLTTTILKTLAFTALASAAFLFLNSKRKKTKKNKEALAYEVW